MGILIGIIFLYGSLMFSASELGGEVVTLSRSEQDGSIKKVRIWIVDADDKTWVEHGTSKSFWINQLTNQPEISLIRGGEEKEYIAVPDINSHDIYHQLRKEKYGIAARIVEILSFGLLEKEACTGVSVRLKKK